MEDRTETIRHDIDATRESMTEKMEQIESKVRGTVENVKGSVENTVENVKQVFDVKQQVSERPWMMLGASVLTGYALGSLIGSDDSGPYRTQNYGKSYYTTSDYTASTTGESYRYSPSSAPSYSSSSDFKPRDYATTSYSNSYSPDRSQAQRPASGLMSGLMDQFGDELETLKDAAIVTVGNMLRDMLRKNLPQFADEFERARSERERRISSEGAASTSQSYDPLERAVGSTTSGADAAYQSHTTPGEGATTGTAPSSTIRGSDPVSNADRNTTY